MQHRRVRLLYTGHKATLSVHFEQHDPVFGISPFPKGRYGGGGGGGDGDSSGGGTSFYTH